MVNAMNPNYEVPVNFNNTNPSQKSWSDTASSVWDTLTSPITTVYHDVVSGISTVWSDVHQSTTDVLSTASSLGNAAITGVESVIGKTESSVVDLAKTASNTVTAIGSDIQGTASLLSLPLLAAGGLALILLLRK